MGKVIEFKRIETQNPKLTELEVEACKVARTLRETFTEEEVEAIRLELETEDGLQ